MYTNIIAKLGSSWEWCDAFNLNCNQGPCRIKQIALNLNQGPCRIKQIANLVKLINVVPILQPTPKAIAQDIFYAIL